jgi:hypothetical protein
LVLPIPDEKTERPIKTRNPVPTSEPRQTTDESVPERLRRMKKDEHVSDQKRQEAHEKSSHSATDEPWKKPGQTSQDENQQPTPNVVEQEKAKKGIK